MALNTSSKDIIAHRRMLVARARIRGITQREIILALQQQGVVNPNNGKAWTPGTICMDIKAIEKAWREEMLKDTSEHKARILAELVEIKRKGWSQDDVEIVLKALTQERAVIGVDAPKEIALEWKYEAQQYGIDSESIIESLTAMLIEQFAVRRAPADRIGLAPGSLETSQNGIHEFDDAIP